MALQQTHREMGIMCVHDVLLLAISPYLSRIFSVRVSIARINKACLRRMVKNLCSSGHDLTATHTKGKHL